MENTFKQPTQNDLEREQFRLGLASAQNKAYTQSQADTRQNAAGTDYTAAPDRVSFNDLSRINQSVASGIPKSDTPVLDFWKRQQAAKKNAQDDFFWNLPFLIGDFDPGFSIEPSAAPDGFDPGLNSKLTAFSGGFDGGLGAGRSVPEQPAARPSLPWLNTPQYGDDGTLFLQEKLAQTGNSGYDKGTRKIGGLIDEVALDAAIAEAFPEYSPDDDDEDDWLEKPLQPDDDEDDWLESGEKTAAAGAAWSNPYGGMGIQDADYEAYRAGKLTQDDLLGIARAVALYRAAEGGGNGAYYYQNDAHRRAAEIRVKYDPDYVKNDAYDYTHGGKYAPNSTEPISGPPRYKMPDSLYTNEHTDLINSTQGLSPEKGTDEWDTLQFISWWLDYDIHGGKFEKIEPFKDQWIAGYKDAIIAAAEKYDVQPVLLAGVIHNEVGGDPLWADDLMYMLRSIPDIQDFAEYIPVAGRYLETDKDRTSFGNASVQVLTAAETLGYDPEHLTQKQKDAIIATLKDPVQGIFVAAKHLAQLKNVDFKDKDSEDLTEEDLSIIASRYNCGSGASLDWVKQHNGYGVNVTDRISKLIELLGLKN
jgi:hypothetical protein